MDAHACCVKMYETIYYKYSYKLNTRNYIFQDIKKTFARMDFFTYMHAYTWLCDFALYSHASCMISYMSKFIKMYWTKSSLESVSSNFCGSWKLTYCTRISSKFHNLQLILNHCVVLLCCVTLAQANILQYPGVDHTFAFGTRLPIMIMSTDTATQMSNNISRVVIQLISAASKCYTQLVVNICLLYS